MTFAADWKSLWPISSTFCPPLLIPNKNPETPLGPLIFTPYPDSSVSLLHSPDLSPHLPPSYPNLSLPRFLQINSVPSSVASVVGPQLLDYSSYFHGFNSLQILQIPDKNLIVVFFPTGENSDDVGYSLLSLKDGVLSVHSRRDNFFQVAKEGNENHHRITRLLVNPVDYCWSNETTDDVSRDARNVNKRSNAVAVVGFLMDEFSVCLDFLGRAICQTLKNKAVMSACWSPHFGEECLVLLENGDFLMFDVNYSCGKKGKTMFSFRRDNRVVKLVMYVSLNDKLGLEGKNGDIGLGWFGCEFSWHPRLFIAANGNEVFLVDLRSAGDCKVGSLLKLEMLSAGKDDGFLSLSRVSSDEFSFTVATRNLLLLCDVRKPLTPVLRWAHDLQNPHYMTVFELSTLRANVKDNKYKWASESGHCILLGSFWDNEFSLFCYGPDCSENGSVPSEISKFCNSRYAWGHPSSLSFSASDCNCGSCLVRKEFFRASLPVWIDWREKKQLTLGFGILEPHFSAQLFSAVALEGKLVAQHYTAAWESEKVSEVGHKRKRICLEDNLLYDRSNLEYDGVKKFQHMKFEFLNAFLKDRLAKYIVQSRGKRKESDEDAHKDNLVKSESNFHKEICNKLKPFGFPRDRSSLAVLDVLKDTSSPTSIHEIALRSTCAALPSNMLQLAFSTYSEFNEDLEKQTEPLEFLEVPDELQVPPFPFRKPSHRSNKWSRKVRPPDTVVGPILPPHFLNILYKIRMEERKDEKELYLEETDRFSAHSQLKLQCGKVVEVVEEHVSGSDAKTQEDDFVRLGDDTEETSYETQKVKLCYHQPSAYLENPSSMGSGKPGHDDYIYNTHVFRKNEELASELSAEMVGTELFDVGCPTELKFADCAIDFGQKELEAYQNLKKLDLDFQRRFKPYQDYISRGN
ncbi:hypothetical protein CDL12_06665 [Handroanthus impetiginosus]|uniref:Uncharacterized protein n=1 Tax=Handroanthus impetiginosus TaxID=429701 RepID=A0A2G9HT01_9LAMI|nr:hypothetical protein CDL12_06665 [Handroanthus impetiginosus]